MRLDPIPPVSIKTCAGQGWGSELTTVMIRRLVDLDRCAYLKCLWSRIYHVVTKDQCSDFNQQWPH